MRDMRWKLDVDDELVTLTVEDGGKNTFESRRDVYNRTLKMARLVMDEEVQENVAPGALRNALLALPVYAKAAVVADWETGRIVQSQTELNDEWLSVSGDGDEGTGEDD